MRRSLSLSLAALSVAVSSSPSAWAEEIVIPIAGDVADDGTDFDFVPFDVPAGIVEIEIRHDDLSEENILDWGLEDPSGAFRGWGGGNTEPGVVGEAAASRSYLAGSIPTGTWRVQIGKAKIAKPPGQYQIEVVLRDVSTLPPQPEREPYAPRALATEARWYAGDFHVHSRESGDAVATMTFDDIAELASAKGLDFVQLSDHNTVSQLDFLVDAQSRHPSFLFMPGVEFTTYAGHANGLGATVWVDHKMGLPGVTIEAAAEAFAAQGALLSINHPALDIAACIGCAWDHELAPEHVGAVEIATGGWKQSGFIFDELAIAFWDSLCDSGAHIAAIGGSDDHSAGESDGAFASPIGDPTTLVWATELSSEAIVDGIRRGRTVVKLQGPDDPMIELGAEPALTDDSLSSHDPTITAVVTGGAGHKVRFVKNGKPLDEVAIDADPFAHTLAVVAPPTGEDRYRAEVLVEDRPRTVTSHVWISDGPAVPDAAGGSDPEGGEGCGCAVPGRAPGVWGALSLSFCVAGWLARGARRRRRA